jgi:hypothetical protein
MVFKSLTEQIFAPTWLEESISQYWVMLESKRRAIASSHVFRPIRPRILHTKLDPRH